MLVLNSHDASVIRTALLLYPGSLPPPSDAPALTGPVAEQSEAQAEILIDELRRLSEDPIGISDGAEYAELSYEVAVGHQNYVEQEAIAMTRACRAALSSPSYPSLCGWIQSLIRDGNRRLDIIEGMTRAQRMKAIQYDPSSIMDTVEF